MKYYFYNEEGVVTTVYYVEPPVKELEKAHVKSDVVFDEKVGFSKILKVDLDSLELKCEYVENPPTIEDEVDSIKMEMAVTQSAVDFLLMNSIGSINLMVLGENDMAAYFAMRIIKGMLKYEDVIKKYTTYKEDIDFILRSEGREDLITM